MVPYDYFVGCAVRACRANGRALLLFVFRGVGGQDTDRSSVRGERSREEDDEAAASRKHCPKEQGGNRDI